MRESLLEGAVYYQATRDTAALQLDDFRETAAEQYPGVSRLRDDWEAVVGYLGERDATVVIDEWPFLVEADDTVPTVFQRLWDTELSETAATLVLVGSSISIMTEKITERDAPLYGRDTVRLDLAPLSLGDAAPFYPATPSEPETVLRAWSVFGGTPFYLQLLDSDDSLADNVNRHVVAEHGRLHGEPETLLQAEGVRRPERYTSVLRAVADGKRTTSEIANYAGFDDTGSLWRYAERLKTLRLLEEDQPVTEETTRPKRYRLREPLFRFWFRFCYRKTKRYTATDDPFGGLIEPAFSQYVGRSFERVCREALPALFPEAPFGRVGGWWDGDGELDVVGLDHGGRLFGGEAKYESTPMHHGHLENVRRRTDRVGWTPPGAAEVTAHHCLFSRSGFTDSLHETADEDPSVHLFGVDEVVRALTE